MVSHFVCLFQVNGERNPSEVYVDFRDAVMRILGLSENGGFDRSISQSLQTEVSDLLL